VSLTKRTAVDQAYTPLFKLRIGVLKGGVFHTAPIILIKYLSSFVFLEVLTSLKAVGVRLMDSSTVVELVIHFLVKERFLPI